MQHTIRKLLCCLLCMLLVCAAMLPAIAAETTMQTATAQAPAQFASNNKKASLRSIAVSDTIKELLRTAIVNCEPSINISGYNIAYSHDLLNAFYGVISNEFAEAFHVNGLSCTYSGGYFYELKFSYSCSAEEYAQQYAACTSAADKLLDGIENNADLTDVEKALLLHDRLALHCEYGDVYADRYETATLYGALVGRKPVCQGYAVAYMYLLEQIGIESEITSSEMLNHAWNIVYIDGTAYHVDVTWDDPTADVYGRVMHNNFLLSTTALQTGVNDSDPHDADDFNLTPSDTSYDSYFWQNSEAAFQLLNDEIYYIDSVAQEIRKMSGHNTLASVADTWHISDTGYYLVGNFAKLACVNDTLYCSMPEAVYTVNTNNGAMELFYEPELTIDGERFYCIEGFAYENNTLYFDYANINGGYINTQKTSVTLTPEIRYGDIDNDGNVSAGDARIALRVSVGLETISEAQLQAADIDGDHAVTAGDARLILRYSVGLTSDWPR